MNRTLLALLSAFSLASPWLSPAAEELEVQEAGSFSRQARAIWKLRLAPQQVAAIPSPDGKKAILVSAPSSPGGEERHAVRVRVGKREFPTAFGRWFNAEAAWTADSRAFFVTYSDGGDDGTYHVAVVQVTAGGLRISEPLQDGRALFQPTCAEPEVPSVAAVGWPARDASRLLLAVVVPPGSTCSAARTFRAFEVRLPGARVLERYDQFQAKREFRTLMGEELTTAPDECIRNPSACPAGARR